MQNEFDKKKIKKKKKSSFKISSQWSSQLWLTIKIGSQ
jgi:hypothetical protein